MDIRFAKPWMDGGPWYKLARQLYAEDVLLDRAAAILGNVMEITSHGPMQIT